MLTGIVALFRVWNLSQVKIPVGPLFWVFICLILSATSSLFVSQSPRDSIIHYMILLSAVWTGISLCNVESRSYGFLLTGLFIIAVFESLLAGIQQLSIRILPDVLLIKDKYRVFGTFGNPEFLATYLGVAFFIGCYLLEKYPVYRWYIIISLAAIISALVCTRNKGALLIIGLYFLQILTRKKYAILLLCTVLMAVLFFFFPDTCKGRILLWLSSFLIFLKHPLTGVGFHQIGHYNLDGISLVYKYLPFLKPVFEQHAANVLDGHNIVLNWGVETGVLGFTAAGLLVVFCLRVVKGVNRYIGAAFVFLIVKSLYTVVLNATTGLMLFIIIVCQVLPVKQSRISFKKRFPIGFVSLIYLIGTIYAGYFVTADFWYQKSMKSIMRADLVNAQKYIRKALTINPQNSDAHLASGHIYFLTKNKIEMSRHLDESIRLFKSMNSLKISAHMYFYSGMYGQARDLYCIILKYYPDHLTSLAKLSQIYFYENNYKRAHEYASKVLDTEPRVKNESDYTNKRIAAEIINITGPLLFKGNE